jgi:hypothetical protein
MYQGQRSLCLRDAQHLADLVEALLADLVEALLAATALKHAALYKQEASLGDS